MAETEVKSINGKPVADVTARAKIDEIKNAAPGLVFETVADMEAYIAENAGTLKVGQDLFIREADVPDYWWDGTKAVEVETDLSGVKEDIDKLSKEIVEHGKTIPRVFDWANAELPFTESEISGTIGGAGFVVNPDNFADGKTYFRYHAGETNFTWTNPNPQVGAVTLTVLSWKQWDKDSTGNSSTLNILYDDGTTDIFKALNGVISTFTTDANKVLSQIKGNYDIENWILLDMDVLSIVADYPAPTGTVKTVNGVEPDENGNVEIDIPEGGGSGGTDIALGITGAAVGQIARITAVDESGVPTAWEAVDFSTELSTPPLLADVTFEEDVTNPDVELSSVAKRWVLIDFYNASTETKIGENYPRINGAFADMFISEIKAKGHQLLRVELLAGGYIKLEWTDTATGVWDGTTKTVCGKGALFSSSRYIGGLTSIGRHGEFVAGSCIRAWGE